jgi:ssDNA-binding replication factor A large subunit
MTESLENIVNLILLQNPSLPREELMSLLERKKQDSHGLLSDEGAIRLLAQQLSVTMDSPESVADQRIASVQAGLMDASITGEVVSISQLQEFQRTDGSTGKVLRIRLGDSSGQITCVCWDSIGEFVAGQSLGTGSRLRLEHGYTKYGRGGETEFHLGSRSSIQMLTTTVLPQTSNEVFGVAGLRPGARVNRLRLRVRSIAPNKSEKGPVQALCEDETGLVMTKFWDENKNVALTLNPSMTITIHSPWIREWNGLVDLNVGKGSTVMIEEFAVGSPRPVSVGLLKAEPFLRIISGRLVEKSDVREIETREGRKARVSNIRVEDDTGRIRVSLWDKHAESVDMLRLGDTIRLTGVKIRPSAMGEMEASTVFLTQLEKT